MRSGAARPSPAGPENFRHVQTAHLMLNLIADQAWNPFAPFGICRRDCFPVDILVSAVGGKGAFLRLQGFGTAFHSINPVSYTHLDVYKRQILTCGTCLNFYGLSEKLQVGSVTNMYEIVERMTAAKLLVRP